ncbi:hypothetical protein G7046_g7866 [Stylonectria norvegica]|nr:hypothetical protein G7046_g7866 [Stylonectria norvegica]
MASHPIPLSYRLPLLYIEPLLALNGAAILLLSPTTFLTTMTPHAASPAGALRSVRILTDQLAILQLVFAFNLAVVLRATRDPLVWRVMCAGMLASDVLHVGASVRELGWQATCAPGLWRSQEWLNFGILGAMGLVRLGVVLGIGLRGGGGGGAAAVGREKRKGN